MVLRDGNTYRVLSDQLGSPRLVVDMNDSSNVPYRADYEAFGEVTGTGLEWMPFGFAGGIYDAATGLVRFGARDYDASTGRWTAKDPVIFDGGTANLYEYAGSDPVNYRDPTGRIPLPLVLAIACETYAITSAVLDVLSVRELQEEVEHYRRLLKQTDELIAERDACGEDSLDLLGHRDRLNREIIRRSKEASKLLSSAGFDFGLSTGLCALGGGILKQGPRILKLLK